MDYQPAPLRINVGFIVKHAVGFNRVFPFDFGEVSLQDLALESLKGEADISRTPNGLLLEVHFFARTIVECARCLKNFEINLETEFTELFVESPRDVSESEPILPEDGHIDLAPLARDYLLIEIPINPTCTPDCKGLCQVCGENLNETECNHDVEDVDPRLEVLKKLLPES